MKCDNMNLFINLFIEPYLYRVDIIGYYLSLDHYKKWRNKHIHLLDYRSISWFSQRRIVKIRNTYCSELVQYIGQLRTKYKYKAIC